MNATHEKLKQAWLHRFGQQNDQSHLLLLGICQEVGLPTDVHKHVDLSKFLNNQDAPMPVDTAVIIDAVTLLASLARTRRQLKSGEALLLRLESAVSKASATLTFHFYFERGIQRFLAGDYSTAQDFFLLSFLKATEPFDQCASKINAMLCLDNLGLPVKHTLSELQTLIRTLDPYDSRSLAVTSQLEHFLVRQDFRSGKLAKVYSAEHDSHNWGQVRYLKLWTSLLPYLNYPYKTNDELEEFLQYSGYYPNHSYCTRTLLGLCHPTDLDHIKWTDWADRLYLWTWRWLSDPKKFPFERIATLLAVFSDGTHNASTWLTEEDRLMVRNTLQWLSLLDSSSKLSLRPVLSSIAPALGQEVPLLDFEYEVISYFIARRDRDLVLARDYYQNILRHRCWNDSYIGLQALVRAIDDNDCDLTAIPPQLRTLALHLQEALKSSDNQSTIVVDMETHTIASDRAPAVVCEFTCRALELLKHRSSVPMKEFVAVVYSITRYDSLVHSQRVFASLRKMREIFGEHLNLRTKGACVLCEGDWGAITILQPSVYHDLAHNVTWRDLLTRRKELVPRPLAPSTPVNGASVFDKQSSNLEEDMLTRKELEKLTGKARSSAHRMLTEWEQKGWVLRSGQARSTKYKVTPSLKAYLQGEKQ